MIIQTIEIALLMPKELKPGHRIINLGIVESVEEWADCFVLTIFNSGTFLIQKPKYQSVSVLTENGSPKIEKPIYQYDSQ